MLLLVVPLLMLQISGIAEHAWAALSAVLATIAIGFFAVWSLLANATSALILLAFRPFRVGDDVDLVEPGSGAGLSGRVQDMNLMFTTLQERSDGPDRQAGTLHIPNSMFFQKVVRVRPTMPAVHSTPFFAASQVPKPPQPLDSPHGSKDSQ